MRSSDDRDRRRVMAIPFELAEMIEEINEEPGLEEFVRFSLEVFDRGKGGRR